MHQFTTPSLSQTIWLRWVSRQFLTVPRVQTLLPVTFAYSLSSEAVVMRQLRRWKRLWRRSLTRSHKRTSMGTSRSYWNGTSAEQPEEITSKGTRVSCVYYLSGNLLNDPRIYIDIYSIRQKTKRKNWIIFHYCHKFRWNFNGLDTHRKWLFSLIIVDKVSWVREKSHHFLKRKFSEIPKGGKVLGIFPLNLICN